jgi:hypothetical protein
VIGLLGVVYRQDLPGEMNINILIAILDPSLLNTCPLVPYIRNLEERRKHYSELKLAEAFLL